LAQVQDSPGMIGADLTGEVTTAEPYVWTPNGPTRFRVVALDYGIKRNILRLLGEHGCEVHVLPASATAEEVLALDPDGVFLSNGPGDPAAVTQGIAT